MLPNNKAYGFYSCSVRILKVSGHIISQPLAQIFNASVSTGSFPAKLKLSKVVQILKSGDKSQPGNYRPISLLQICNRRLEKLVYKCSLSLLTNIIYYIHLNTDSAVRIVHSMLLLTNFDKGLFTCCFIH